MAKLSGRVALVTGAGSGIGRASARVLAKEGAVVGTLDVLEARVGEVCAEIAAAGGEAMPLVADVADEAGMRRAVSALAGEARRLDIVAACAGTNGVWAPVDEILPAEWDRTVAVNLRGNYLTRHLAVPHLKAARGGSVVTGLVTTYLPREYLKAGASFSFLIPTARAPDSCRSLPES